VAPPLENTSYAAAARLVHFRCRRCRAVLCRSDQLEDPPHEEGRHHFSHHRRRKEGLAQLQQQQQQPQQPGLGGGFGGAAGGEEPPAPACTSVFLAEALQWMRSASLDPVEGKLLCFGCGARVGALRWAGSQCSCGTWVCPAVQLYRSCLDDIAVAAPAVPQSQPQPQPQAAEAPPDRGAAAASASDATSAAASASSAPA